MKGLFARALMGVWLALCLIGCASTQSGPRMLTVSESQLQSLIEKKLNPDHTLLSLFEIRLAKPQVKLHPETNRVHTDLDVQLKNPLSGSMLQGKMGVSGSLDWNSEKQVLGLVRLRAESFSIDGLPSQYSAQVNQLGTTLAEQFLRDFAVYEAPAEGVQYRGRAYVPTEFTIKEGAIEIKLTPRA